MAGDVKTKVSIEGAAEYRKQLTNITKQAKALSSEMKAATSAFTENTTAEEKNRTTSQLLTKQIEIQKQKVALIEEQWKKAAAAMGENSDAALDLKNDLNKANAELNNMNKALQSTNKTLPAGFDDVRRGGSAFRDAADGAGTFAFSLQNIAQIVAASAVFKAVVDGVKEIVNAFAEYEQVSGGVEALFGAEAAAIIEQNAFKAYKTAGVSANQYLTQVTNFSAALLKSVEGDTVRAAFIADQAIRDMADNANRFGTDLSSLQAAYAGFSRQQFQLLDNLKLGYAGTKEGMEQLLAEAEKLTGNEFDISNLADIYEAIHAIQESMGVTGTTAAEAEDTIIGSAAAMSAAWSNLLVGIAQDSEEIDELMMAFSESAELWMGNVLLTIQEIMPAIAGLLPEFLQFGIDALWQVATGLLKGVAYAIAAAGEVIAEIIAELFGHDVDFEGAGENVVNQIWEGFANAWRAFRDAVKQALAELGIIINEGTANIEAGLNISSDKIMGAGTKGAYGSPVSGIPVTQGAKGLAVGSITVNGYSASDGFRIARDIDRELGRLYE